ncbi:MAG: hypothetical protein H7039_03605 [Bryobacteraceae bacterium]|nr:hypothetical protein [Bryobacteraceae bacterium]
MRLANTLTLTLTTALVAFGQADIIHLRVPPPAPSESASPVTMQLSGSADAQHSQSRGYISTFDFVRSEFGSGEVVKSAPYSAEATTETVQTLQDGNRIVHRDSTTIARDGQGRTRRDLTMPLLPGLSAADAPKLSFIFDPAANISYTLDHNSKTVRKMTGQGASVHFSTKSDSGATAVIDTHVVTKDRPSANRMVFMRTESPDAKGGKTESLGKQTIEGVLAEGTRSVTTIPAGQIGNERAIEVVNERWYSPQLKTVILSRHTDPRQGETTYKLTNLRLGEPSPGLFEVPANYTVQTANERIIQFDRTPAPKE